MKTMSFWKWKLPSTDDLLHVSIAHNSICNSASTNSKAVLSEQVCFLFTECTSKGGDLTMCSCITKATNYLLHYLWVYLSCFQGFNITLTWKKNWTETVVGLPYIIFNYKWMHKWVGQYKSICINESWDL